MMDFIYKRIDHPHFPLHFLVLVIVQLLTLMVGVELTFPEIPLWGVILIGIGGAAVDMVITDAFVIYHFQRRRKLRTYLRLL